MPMVVRARSFPSHLWPSLLVGAVFGAGVSWLAVSGRFRRRADPDDRGLLARLKRRQVEPDLDALAALLRAWPGAEELRMKSFGEGILGTSGQWRGRARHRCPHTGVGGRAGGERCGEPGLERGVGMSDVSKDLPSRLDARAIEPPLYREWLERGWFHVPASAVLADGRDPYVIVIPPPNVTAVLHMGHGLNNTVQDVLIRWRRMQGRAAEWLPGTDHAGIATQKRCRAPAGRGGKDPRRLGPRRVRRARVELRARDGRHHPRAAPVDRRLLRLGAHRVHA